MEVILFNALGFDSYQMHHVQVCSMLYSGRVCNFSIGTVQVAESKRLEIGRGQITSHLSDVMESKQLHIY